MSHTAIFNCDLFTPDEHISQGVVLIEGREIQAIGRSYDIPLPTSTRLIDAQGGRVTPGLIDLGGMIDSPMEARGTTSYLLRVSVRDERDLQKVGQTAAHLPSPRHRARSLGLHVVGSWLPNANNAPHWQDLWLASDATIKLISLRFQAPGGGQDYAICQNFGDHLPEIPSINWTTSDAQVALWGLPDSPEDSSSSHHLVTLDQLRSTDRSVLRSLLSSHRLILAGDNIQPLGTRSIRQLMALADTDFTNALAAATLAPAEFLGSPLGRLAAGAPADLICWTRHGDLAWAMVGGEIVHPEPKSASSARQQPHRDQQSQVHNSAFRQQAISDIHHFLESRDDTLAVHLVGNQPRSKRKGIDLRWRFRRDDGGEETVSIGVQTNGGEKGDGITFTTRDAPSTTSACSLEHTEADWCFYYVSASQRLVCLPVRATRTWLHKQHNNADLQIPIAELQAAIPRLRLLHLNPKRSGKKDEADQD